MSHPFLMRWLLEPNKAFTPALLHPLPPYSAPEQEVTQKSGWEHLQILFPLWLWRCLQYTSQEPPPFGDMWVSRHHFCLEDECEWAPKASLLLLFELQAAYPRMHISLGLGDASNLIIPSLKTNNILHLYGAFHQPQVTHTMLELRDE